MLLRNVKHLIILYDSFSLNIVCMLALDVDNRSTYL